MTHNEFAVMYNNLSTVFDIVRLIDTSKNLQYDIDEDGNFIPKPYKCFRYCNNGENCESCISNDFFPEKKRMTKFEFVDDDVYYITSKYIKIDGKGYVVEMISIINDETLFEACGKNEFVQRITDYNKKIFTDSLTGAYNRRYFDEKIKVLGKNKEYAFAMIDADCFKEINDTYGHKAGDAALRTIVTNALRCIRSDDMVIRYGGDEFVIVFKNIPKEIFKERLESIRKRISESILEEFPELKITVSIGGATHGGSDGDLFDKADEMVYRAKEEKNKVVIE